MPGHPTQQIHTGMMRAGLGTKTPSDTTGQALGGMRGAHQMTGSTGTLQDEMSGTPQLTGSLRHLHEIMRRPDQLTGTTGHMMGEMWGTDPFPGTELASFTCTALAGLTPEWRTSRSSFM